MDNFTLAVVIGIVVVLLVFVGLTVADKGPPEAGALREEGRKKSA